MIGTRADIEGSKSNVAMNAYAPEDQEELVNMSVGVGGAGSEEWA